MDEWCSNYVSQTTGRSMWSSILALPSFYWFFIHDCQQMIIFCLIFQDFSLQLKAVWKITVPCSSSHWTLIIGWLHGLLESKKKDELSLPSALSFGPTAMPAAQSQPIFPFWILVRSPHWYFFFLLHYGAGILFYSWCSWKLTVYLLGTVEVNRQSWLIGCQFFKVKNVLCGLSCVFFSLKML